MKQNVTFNYLNHSIECKVEWEGQGLDFSINFFNPQTGYTNQSDPMSTMNGWSYQDPQANYEMGNLIEAIRSFYYHNGSEWVEHLSWEEDVTDEFKFVWDGESFSNEIAYYNDEEPIYYKELDYKR